MVRCRQDIRQIIKIRHRPKGGALQPVVSDRQTESALRHGMTDKRDPPRKIHSALDVCAESDGATSLVHIQPMATSFFHKGALPRLPVAVEADLQLTACGAGMQSENGRMCQPVWPPKDSTWRRGNSTLIWRLATFAIQPVLERLNFVTHAMAAGGTTAPEIGIAPQIAHCHVLESARSCLVADSIKPLQRRGCLRCQINHCVILVTFVKPHIY